MKGRTVPLQNHPEQNRFTLGIRILLLTFMVAQWIAGPAHAQAAVVALPRITFIVFADMPMPDGEWAALFEDLHQGYANLALEMHFHGSVDVIRGDSKVRGIQVDVPVSIYLHGNCTLLAQPDHYVVQGALGWVLRDHGHIEPFIHVDCTRIGEMLGQHALGMNRDRRNVVMAEAISRVVLH